MFRHIVLFRVRDEVTDPEVDAAMAELRTLGDEPGVRTWTVELSLDTRKGRIIVEDATFDDAAAFAVWRETQSHGALASRMASIADWWVGDWQHKPHPATT